jgi:hypothetical protein
VGFSAWAVLKLRAEQGPPAGQDAGSLEPAARQRVNANQHILLRGGTIVAMDPGVGDLATGDVLIQGKRIVAVGRDLKAPGGAQIIDAVSTIAIPGFVDCHRHSWSAQFRRIIPDGLIQSLHGDAAQRLCAPITDPSISPRLMLPIVSSPARS